MPRLRDPETQQRILDAAATLFYERGIQAVGMAELASAAGCGKSVLYREFASKDDLVLAFLQRFAARREEDERRATTEATDAGEALVLLVRRVASLSERPAFRGCPFRNYVREFLEPDTEAFRYAERWLGERRALVQQLAHRTGVVEPEVVADQVWLLMEGLWSSAPYDDRRGLGEAAVSLVNRLVAAQACDGP